MVYTVPVAQAQMITDLTNLNIPPGVLLKYRVRGDSVMRPLIVNATSLLVPVPLAL